MESEARLFKKRLLAEIPGFHIVSDHVRNNETAFACKLSFQRGGEGFVSFVEKTKLVNHYIETLGAVYFGGQLMVINTDAAIKLINKYF